MYQHERYACSSIVCVTNAMRCLCPVHAMMFFHCACCVAYTERLTCTDTACTDTLALTLTLLALTLLALTLLALTLLALTLLALTLLALTELALTLHCCITCATQAVVAGWKGGATGKDCCITCAFLMHLLSSLQQLLVLQMR